MVYFVLDALNQAVNAAVAHSVGVGRLVLAAQQLQDCREQNNPHRNSWLPGMPAQNLQWAADPCQKEQDQVDELMKQSAAAGNQVATQQLGGAPAPQLAESTDPVGNTDPAIPMSEYVVPQVGAQNPWSPVLPEDALEAILMEYQDQEPPEDMILDEILEMMRYFLLWCPWGGPGRKNLKWRFRYNPNNSDWAGKWIP
ncbi:nonstructural protein 2 [Duck-associated chapparvovirus 2]|uniref:Nonstructural protein 2 n=1 Tax=Duck-associated chapparvovirus 2 TaxID=2810803 RepID=A0A891F0C7_9VIRU|nr:nonstructural protein 2 [Duck-associated chapparvovirus 2]QRK03691.1 nonstructural protein 2 [Duck-associated chapparvovirus 2]QRK03695.1 nonstructural protein 2 [Duck-associated chapparvovirus 2]